MNKLEARKIIMQATSAAMQEWAKREREPFADMDARLRFINNYVSENVSEAVRKAAI